MPPPDVLWSLVPPASSRCPSVWARGVVWLLLVIMVNGIRNGEESDNNNSGDDDVDVKDEDKCSFTCSTMSSMSLAVFFFFVMSL